MFNCNFNKQSRDHLLPYQNTSLKKTNAHYRAEKKKSRKAGAIH